MKIVSTRASLVRIGIVQIAAARPILASMVTQAGNLPMPIGHAMLNA
jgi:hypothetical protein